MGQPIPPQTGTAGGHEHPHDHPHDHPDMWARIDTMRTDHDAAMEQLRTDVRADRDVTAANDAAMAAEAAAHAAMEAAQAAAEDGEDGDDGDPDEVEEEIVVEGMPDKDEALEPPPAPMSHTPPGPKKTPGMWDKYPAHKKP